MLEVVRLAMGVLSAREDSCLPMAHRLWPALVQRLTGDEWRVILAAFKTLVSLSRVCGDFLRRRVSGELLGPVAASLAARAPVSAAAGAEGRRGGGRGGRGGRPCTRGRSPAACRPPLSTAWGLWPSCCGSTMRIWTRW
ncbi:TELO2-interacting protein 1 homolog [Lethenteron reissneri]|uniref:TELO2-interacting protein 1 homolog n=1 Tax=Lethenteron reissneri TaxID=7753 RepID=UPI002AB63BB0|nr:TELO2-interacting protein 1 homolog [Lethenteron reissneri]